MKNVLTGMLCLFAWMLVPALAQKPPDSTAVSEAVSSKLTTRYVSEVGNRSQGISQQIDKSTTQYLDRLKKQEASLQQRLFKVDSNAAKRIFSNSAQSYDNLQNQLKNNGQNVLRSCG